MNKSFILLSLLCASNMWTMNEKNNVQFFVTIPSMPEDNCESSDEQLPALEHLDWNKQIALLEQDSSSSPEQFTVFEDPEVEWGWDEEVAFGRNYLMNSQGRSRYTFKKGPHGYTIPLEQAIDELHSGEL